MTAPIPISRRRFLAHAAILSATTPAVGRALVVPPIEDSLLVGVIDTPSAADDPRAMGLVLGAEEASHAAAMFGGRFELVPVSPSAFRPSGLSAVIGDGDHARCATLAAAANDAGVPFFNIACTADDLRGLFCRRTMFHIVPSDAMYRDAVAATHLRGPALAWHPSLNRFGADTLNRRFLARFGHAMTSDAWPAWMATKVIWESSLRARSTEPAKLIAYLSRDTTQFDGHKGLPLSFRSWDRQLRQPVYVTTDSAVVEAPATKSSATEGSRAVLDQLGAGPANTGCRATR
jgi:hypothetical protein